LMLIVALGSAGIEVKAARAKQAGQSPSGASAGMGWRHFSQVRGEFIILSVRFSFHFLQKNFATKVTRDPIPARRGVEAQVGRRESSGF
jgi:hypothetical protein